MNLEWRESNGPLVATPVHRGFGTRLLSGALEQFGGTVETTFEPTGLICTLSWTADEWASSSPPEKAETTIPQGVPCTRLANLILAPKQERQRIAAYIPRWGIQLAAHLSESTAWAIYRDRLKRFGSLIGDREPIVLHKEIPGMGRAGRYIITIADDDRAPLDKLRRKLIAADATCDVLRNPVRTDQ